MSMSLIPLPQFTDADPPAAGEGSLDPLGLAQVADRLAEYLLPGLRARMRRVRFVTASAVGAMASEDLFDKPAADGIASPSICFEWLVLESFAQPNAEGAPLETAGVPGSSKVRMVVTQGKHLTARNYLRAPGTFGFTGVYLPLARHLQVLDDDRRPAAQITELTTAWERDHGLKGFTDNDPGSVGSKFRNRLRSQVLDSLQKGQCTNENTGLRKQLTLALHPTRAGANERSLLRQWLTSPDEPIRSQIALALAPQPEASEVDLAALLLSGRPSPDLAVRLRAITSYEAVSRLLDAAFRQVRYLSTQLGTVPLSPSRVSGDEVLGAVAKALPGAVAEAGRRIEHLDTELLILFSERLGRFEFPMSPTSLVETLMGHHELIQANKLPKGKRPWFDQLGGGWVVRSPYRNDDRIDLGLDWFVHPYRLNSLQTFMKDLSS